MGNAVLKTLSKLWGEPTDEAGSSALAEVGSERSSLAPEVPVTDDELREAIRSAWVWRFGAEPPFEIDLRPWDELTEEEREARFEEAVRLYQSRD
jgi:hypothetical protein